MPNREVLKEYLVKIGYEVDGSLTDLLDSAYSKLESNSKKIGINFVKAGATLIGVLKDLNSAALNLVTTTANLDLQTERLARKYWIAEDSARALEASLDSLGITFDDLFYATPEQYNRFLQLSNFAKSLEAPPALEETLVEIRDIEAEVSKFKITMQYAARWVVYYLGQMGGEELDDIKRSLSDINSFIVENIPKFTKKIAEVIMRIYSLGKATFKMIKGIGTGIKDLVDEVPGELWELVGIFAAVGMAIKSGPFGIILTLLSGLMLIIEDYMVWQEGGLHHFDWGALEQSGKLKELKESWLELKEAFGDVGDALLDILKIFNLIEDDSDGLAAAIDIITSSAKGLAFVLEKIAKALKTIKEWIDDNKVYRDIEKQYGVGESPIDTFKENWNSLKKGTFWKDWADRNERAREAARESAEYWLNKDNTSKKKNSRIKYPRSQYIPQSSDSVYTPSNMSATFSNFYGYSPSAGYQENIPSYIPQTNIQNKNNSTVNNISFVVNESSTPIETAENIAETLKKTRLFVGGTMV